MECGQIAVIVMNIFGWGFVILGFLALGGAFD